MQVSILLYLLAYCVICRILYTCLQNYKVSRTNRSLCVVVLFLLSAFSVWSGDYHHLGEYYITLSRGVSTNVEDLYVYIAQNITSNYLQFRLLLWGGSFILVLYTYKRLNIWYEMSLLFFAAISLLWFSYARVSCGMAFMFFGFSLLAAPQKKHKLTSYLFGFIFIGLSYFFHKSTPFGIAMIILALFASSLNRKKIFLLTGIFFLVIMYANYYLTMFLSMDSDTELVAVNSAKRYMESSDSGASGLGALIQIFLQRVNYYIVLFIIIKSIINKKFLKFPRDIKMFSSVSLFIILGATAFAFNLGYNTSTVYYRFLNFSIIPIVVVLSYCYKERVDRKLCLTSLWTGLLGSLYALFYSFYLSCIK